MVIFGNYLKDVSSLEGYSSLSTGNQIIVHGVIVKLGAEDSVRFLDPRVRLVHNNPYLSSNKNITRRRSRSVGWHNFERHGPTCLPQELLESLDRLVNHWSPVDLADLVTDMKGGLYKFELKLPAFTNVCRDHGKK